MGRAFVAAWRSVVAEQRGRRQEGCWEERERAGGREREGGGGGERAVVPARLL